MLRLSLRGLAATSGAFSSAAFTGDDNGAFEKLRQERQRIDEEHKANAYDSSKFFVGETFTTSANTGSDRAKYEGLTRPTIDTYRAMTDEELITVLRTRESQVAQLRQIYQNFHYEADKHYRKMVLDYHDKSLQFSQVHGRMQNASLQLNREALVKMREQQEMMNRDKWLAIVGCLVFTLCFWVWVRRHYVRRRELEAQLETDVTEAKLRSSMAQSITGMGSWNDNVFGSAKRNARTWETSWEKEVRERREQRERLAAAEEKQRAIEGGLVAGTGPGDVEPAALTRNEKSA